MFRVGSTTVLATTLNVDDDEDDEEDTALFLVLRVGMRRDSSSASVM